METVDLPVMPPLEPMLAKAQAKVPVEAGVWSYEPKWDGFRALVFRDGDKVVVQSRNGKELGRYFPELEQALRDELAPRCVLDGEVVVPREVGGRIRLDWESLSQRIHPAASRIKMLAEQTPAHFIGFDALATGDTSLLKEPFRVRRRALSESVNENLLRTREAVVPRHPHHRGSRAGRAVARYVRGRRAGRRDREEARRALFAGQAGDGQGQARPRRRLRGHRLPHPQER